MTVLSGFFFLVASSASLRSIKYLFFIAAVYWRLLIFASASFVSAAFYFQPLLKNEESASPQIKYFSCSSFLPVID